MAATTYFAISTIFLNKTGGFKWFCAGQVSGFDNICFISFGQMATGIITMGQLTIGIFNFSQIGIGLLLSAGQIQSGIGVIFFAQIASASYVHRCQLGIGFYAVGLAQLGFQFIYSLIWKIHYAKYNCDEATETD